MSALPVGTVTFMFTDIEESTHLLRALGDVSYGRLIAMHNQVIRDALTTHGGFEVKTEGDSFFAVFNDALSALEAAVAIQRALPEARWEGGSAPLVRVGLHTGNGMIGGDDYVGVDVHKASRVSDAGHGGQIVVSETTARLLESRLPEGTVVEPLGKYRLAGFGEPETIHQVSTEGLRTGFPELRAVRATSRLPLPLTDFVGREREIELAQAALRAHRLITLTGPGGTGKTRLSIELARRVEAEYADGCFFVPLAPIRDVSLIATTILEMMGLKTAGAVDPADHLERFLSNKSVLLVLDNFEQLMPGAVLVTRLLERAAGVKMIVSSRIPLRIAGERELPVPPLEVPDLGEDRSTFHSTAGVRLFASRAQAVRPDFQIDESNIATIATIARSLDGLPLAIELAASRIRSLTPDLILERLGNQLLTAPSPDLPERQQTIVNAIGWSYDLLDEPMRRLFEKLSVFTGSFGLREAERLGASDDDPDVLEGLSHLVEHSLVRQTETTGEPRFRMLTVIREFGYGALVSRGDETEMLDRHTAVYLEIAERANAEILTSKQGEWLERLAADHDNLRAVFDRAIAEPDGNTALRLVSALWRFWQIRGHLQEAADRIERALAVAGGADPVAKARALTALGGIRYWQGRWDETLRPYQEALDLFREAGDDVELSEALYNISFPYGYLGMFEEAEASVRESLEISERIRREIGIGRAHWGLSNLAGYQERYHDMIETSMRSIEVFERLDAPFDLGWAWFMVAQGRSKTGDREGTKTALKLALETFAKVVDLSALALIVEMMSLVALADEDREGALYLAGAAHRIKSDTGVEIGDVQLNQYPEIVELVRGRSEEDEVAFQRGWNATLAEQVAEARRILS